jgi:outer membrane protein OmpA-like peptidoglycan-associated protein
MYRLLVGAVALGLLLTVSACCGGRGTTLLLLPEPDGKTGRVIMANQQGRVELDKPGLAAKSETPGKSPGTPYVMEKTEIQQRFGEAISAQPEPPSHFILYFHSGATELTEDSKKLLPKILMEAKRRGSKDVSVVGHTDTAGSGDFNTMLSLRRARAVQTVLIKEGFLPQDIDVSSHGERNLLIKTRDNVSEPQNRRVEVVIR